MLRQFSVRRIVGFFLIDWLGSLAMLLCAALLRPLLGGVSGRLLNLLTLLHIQVGGVGVEIDTTLPWSLVIAVSILWPIIFNTLAVYDGRRNGNIWQELRNVFYAICLSTLVLAGFLFLTYRETSRGLFLIFFLLDVLLLLGSRLALGVNRRVSAARGIQHSRSVLIVGAGEVGRKAAEQARKFGWYELNLVGYLDDDPKKQGCAFDEIPVLGRLDQVSEIVKAHSIQDAIIALPIHSYAILIDICEKLQALSVRVHVIPDMFALYFPNTTLDGFGGIPVIDLGLAGYQGMQRFWKRAFDILVASIFLVIISPFLLILALLVKLDSPGPVIYRQKRIGENGKPFVMYKFRSMRTNTDPSIHQEYVTRLIKENLEPGQLENGKPCLKMQDDRVSPDWAASSEKPAWTNSPNFSMCCVAK